VNLNRYRSVSIELRAPTESDVPEIFRCLASYRFHPFGTGETADPDFDPEAILSMRNSICHVNLEEKCWVAEKEGRILGFCCWDWQDADSGIAKTILITVVPEARSTGVGYLLQQKRLEEMRSLGAREVHTWSDDPKSIQWYQEKFGYRCLDYEPIHHCIHRFFFGDRMFWGIHRGFVERDQLAHLQLILREP
jgi:N-acetylglutamate synthase-like GNAT family acetyltransferase